MNGKIFIPSSPRMAAQWLRAGFQRPYHHLPKLDFLRAWSAVAYLFPGLHPDGFNEADSGWPRVLRGLAIEAWRRFEAGELVIEELYPSDAQWSGLYDRMTRHTPDEIVRRSELAHLSK